MEETRFDPGTVWTQAVRRLLTRLSAAEWAAQLAASARSRSAANAVAKAAKKHAKKAAPLRIGFMATVTEQGLTEGPRTPPRAPTVMCPR